MKPTQEAYSYIRFSSKKQEKGDSLRRQVSLRDEWVTRKRIPLNDSLKLNDLGVSAFRGKNLKTGALSAFIKAVEDGIVPKGSFLLIEKLDRFSRDDVDEALPVFTKLIKAGITVVTLSPEKEWDREAIRGFGIMELVFHFVMANEESEKKSKRLSAAWEEKKRKAAEKLVTSRLPSWLKLVDGKPTKDPEKVALVRRIFDLAEKGYGSGQIAKLFNQEKIPAMLWGNGWHGASICKLLRNRAVLGEYQPCKITPNGPKRRVPVGEPIEGYYPEVIKPAKFQRVQQAIDSRRLARGNVGRADANLFQGIVFDARDGGKVRHKRLGKSHYILPRNAERGLSSDKWAFSYRAFERGLLNLVKELKPEMLLPQIVEADDDDSLDRLAVVERKIETIKKRMLGDGDFDSLIDVLTSLESDRKELLESLAKREAINLNSQKRDLGNLKGILEQLDSAKGSELGDLRVKLKGLFRSLVSEIWVFVEYVDDMKICIAQVHFKAGGVRELRLIDGGKGVKSLYGKSLCESFSLRFPNDDVRAGTVGPHFQDLRLYQHAGEIPKSASKTGKVTAPQLVKIMVDGEVDGLRSMTPQAIALRMVRAGKKPYVVARELRIASSTVYRWVAESA